MYKHTVLLTEDVIQERIRALALELNADYEDRALDIICILKGAVLFVSDLIRLIDIPLRLHFVQISSYEDSTQSSGAIYLHFSSLVDIENRHLLVVEDILDTGITLDYLVKHLSERGPASLKTCVLLDKPDRRRINIQPDYRGFQIADHFVIGYGLDYREFGRNLRYIAVLDPQEYSK